VEVAARPSLVRRNLDLVVVAILTLAGLVAGLLTGLSPLIRGILAVPLVIALPGYALTAALIPDRRSLGRTERTILGVGMSIVVAILVALGLNQLPAGITNQTVAVALSAITLVCVVAGLARRRFEVWQVGETEADDDIQHEASKPFGPELLALAVILTVSAVFVAVLGTVQAPQPGFTQLWMLNGSEANTIQVGIRNQEAGALKYRLEIETQGQILRTAEIDLGSGEQTLQTISLPALTGSTPQTVTARLYRLDLASATTPYRTTLLWRYPPPGPS
jgi:uncharacterized membrane protein